MWHPIEDGINPKFPTNVPTWVLNTKTEREFLLTCDFMEGKWYMSFESNMPYTTSLEELGLKIVAWFEIPNFR